MNARTALLAATLALCAAPQAMPASALAAGALKDVTTQKTVAEGVQFSYSGGIEFDTMFGGISCGVHTTFRTTLADEFEVTKFELTTETCVGWGVFESCIVEDDNPFLPWAAGRYSTTALEFFYFMGYGFDKKCVLGSVKIEGAPVNGIPVTGENGGITALTLSGEGNLIFLDFGGFEVEAVIDGALAIVGENSDTYKIEALP